jgi:hypothetical protein
VRNSDLSWDKYSAKLSPDVIKYLEGKEIPRFQNFLSEIFYFGIYF